MKSGWENVNGTRTFYLDSSISLPKDYCGLDGLMNSD